MAYRKDKQYLYRLTFPNGMVYIGSTFDIKSRWAGNGYKYRDQDVYKHIIEFGWDNIKKEVLLQLPDEIGFARKIEELEREFIRVYGDRCYNKQANPEWNRERGERNRARGMYEPRVFWTINGVTKPAREWCEELGKNYGSITAKMKKYHISAELAVKLPPVPKNKAKHAVEYYRSVGFDIEEAG